MTHFKNQEVDRLEPLPISLASQPSADRHASLIAEAAQLTQRFSEKGSAERIPSLVTSSGNIVWRFLQAASTHINAPSPRFCEWGSGVGLVSCLACHLGWRVTGLDIEPRLVEAARNLALMQKLDASFHPCSYKPDAIFEPATEDTSFDTGHGFDLFDFDVIYAYLWPAERDRVTKAFARHAPAGCILLRYGGGVQCDAFRVRS